MGFSMIRKGCIGKPIFTGFFYLFVLGFTVVMCDVTHHVCCHHLCHYVGDLLSSQSLSFPALVDSGIKWPMASVEGKTQFTHK